MQVKQMLYGRQNAQQVMPTSLKGGINVNPTTSKQPAYFVDLAVLATRRNRLFGNAAFLEETRKAIS
jgi:hypothetical protein